MVTTAKVPCVGDFIYLHRGTEKYALKKVVVRILEDGIFLAESENGGHQRRVVPNGEWRWRPARRDASFWLNYELHW